MFASLAKSRGGTALLVGIAGFALLVGLDALVRDVATPIGDELIYERMAQDPLGVHTFPFGYRIGVPALVHVLPFSHEFSFSLLAWLFSAASGAMMFLLLERLGFDRRLSIAFGLILVVSPLLLVASLRQGRSPDPMTVLVMVTGALMIVERRKPALAAVMLIGAFNRESALFLAPWAYAVWAERPFDRDALVSATAVALPATCAFLALRFGIDTVGQDKVIGYSSLLGGRWDVLSTALDEFPRILRRAFTTFGPFWLLAPIALRDWDFARRGLVLGALCAVAATFALDWQRVALLAAPIVYACSAWTVRSSPRAQLATVGAWVVLICGYAAYMDRIGVERGIVDSPGPGPTYPIQ